VRWVVACALAVVACDSKAPSSPPAPSGSAPAACELAIALPATKLESLPARLAELAGRPCTAVVTAERDTPYPVFVTAIGLAEQAGLRVEVGLDRARLAVTLRSPPGEDPMPFVVIALAQDRAYVAARAIEDRDLERGITAALRERTGSPLALEADTSLTYTRIAPALRAAQAVGAGSILVLTEDRIRPPRQLPQRATPPR